MTDAQRRLIASMCARAAELWATGSDLLAKKWAGVAFTMAQSLDPAELDFDLDDDRQRSR